MMCCGRCAVRLIVAAAASREGMGDRAGSPSDYQLIFDAG